MNKGLAPNEAVQEAEARKDEGAGTKETDEGKEGKSDATEVEGKKEDA